MSRVGTWRSNSAGRRSKRTVAGNDGRTGSLAGKRHCRAPQHSCGAGDKGGAVFRVISDDASRNCIWIALAVAMGTSAAGPPKSLPAAPPGSMRLSTTATG